MMHVEAKPLQIKLDDLIGCRLQNIYGFQQHDLDDLTDDESTWWLEFEGGIWVTCVLEFAPPVVSPCVYLKFYFYEAVDFPMWESVLPFIMNPEGTRAILGLSLLAELKGVSDLLEQRERHLGFGTAGKITEALRIGFLDPFCDGRGSGMGVRRMSEDEIQVAHEEPNFLQHQGTQNHG